MKRERRIALFVIIIVAAFVLAGVVAYFSLRGRSKDGITLQKGVIELAEKDYSDVSIEDNQLRLSGSGAKKTKEGDIIIFQVLDNGAKTARRITGISPDGIASLEKPAYEEVIKEVNFDETIPITFEDFLAGFDVIEETDDTEAGIEGTQYPHVASKKIDAGFMPPIFFDTLGQVDAGEIGLNLKYERDNGEATISLAIYHNGRRVEVAPPTSMPDLTERDLSHAKGSLDIDIKMRDLKVAGHYQTLGGHRSWFNMDGTYEMDVNGSLGMEWEVPLGHGIPVASALGFVEIEITPMLIIRADGTVSLEMWTSLDGKVEYSDFTGFEYEKHIGDRGFEIEGHVRFYGGLRAKASFTLLWDIAIVIDAGVDILTEVDVGSHPRDSGMICLDVDIYSPIVEIFVSFGPIENPIASDKLTLVDKNNKLVKHDHFHYEKYRNGTGDFIQVKKCTYKKSTTSETNEKKNDYYKFGEVIELPGTGITDCKITNITSVKTDGDLIILTADVERKLVLPLDKVRKAKPRDLIAYQGFGYTMLSPEDVAGMEIAKLKEDADKYGYDIDYYFLKRDGKYYEVHDGHDGRTILDVCTVLRPGEIGGVNEKVATQVKVAVDAKGRVLYTPYPHSQEEETPKRNIQAKDYFIGEPSNAWPFTKHGSLKYTTFYITNVKNDIVTQLVDPD